jgi:phage I-like protein
MNTASLTLALMAQATLLIGGADGTPAMMAQLPLPTVANAADGAAPEWIHLLPAPADGLVRTSDQRGPYTMASFAEIIANTFAARDAFEIDTNHASFLAAPRGEAAPAMGWVREMQARADGLWGRVEWTDEGRKLVVGRAYRGISPVVMHDASKKITSLANASLVNRPNLPGLAALHAEETSMNFMEQLAEMLGLPATATQEQIIAALEGKMAAKTEGADAPDMAMQAAMTQIGTALGITGGSTAAIIAAAQATAKPTELLALQSEIAALTTQLNGVSDGRARDTATAFIDGAIRKGHAGVKPLRDRYIAMHMADATGTAELINAMPCLTGGGIAQLAPASDGTTAALNAEESSITKMLGLSIEDFTAARKAELEARA